MSIDQEIRQKFTDMVADHCASMKKAGLYFIRPEVHIWSMTNPPKDEDDAENAINSPNIITKNKEDIRILIMAKGKGLMDYITKRTVDALIDQTKPIGLSYYICLKLDTDIHALFLLFLKDTPDVADVQVFHVNEHPQGIELTPVTININDIHPYYTNNPFQCHDCRKCRYFNEVRSNGIVDDPSTRACER